MSEPAISVVVPCRCHAAELERCLQSLDRQDVGWDYEIIVVDSAADPAVADVVTAFPAVRLVRSAEDLFPGEARNLGVTLARGRYLAFTDADCMPEDGWLQAAIEMLQDRAQLVGGPVLDVYPFHPIAAVDNLMQFMDFSPRRPDGPVPHLPGCNLVLRRSAFEQLGGFPVGTPIAGDTILTSAAAERWPNAVVISRHVRIRHVGRKRIAEFWRHQECFGFYRGRLRLRLSSSQRRLGHNAVFAAMFALRRLVYFFVRTVLWNPTGLPRLILFLPVVGLGLAAWATGLRRGCREAAKEEA